MSQINCDIINKMKVTKSVTFWMSRGIKIVSNNVIVQASVS